MFFKLKNIVLFIGLALATWMSYSGYVYLFDNKMPEITLSGLSDEDYCSGDAACGVKSNKKGEISVWLDDQPLISYYKINASAQGQPFVIPTKTIPNGKHSLRVELVDKTYRKNKAVLNRTFNVDNVPLQAAFVKADSDYKVFQGRTLHIQFQANKEIKDAHVNALSGTYPCFPESKGSLIYECYIPIICEETPSEYLFTVAIADHVGNTLNLDNKFQVVHYPFKKQIIEISPEKLAQERQESNVDNQRFEQLLSQAAKNSPHEKLWKGAFCTPIDVVRVTCDFGTVRTTQHKGRYAHKALDLINKPKSVVWAAQDGVVALKERFEAGGNTIVIDHGWGVLSMYYHLDTFAPLKVGDKVAQGNPVGTIGMTGYATGYHLHWEMRVNDIPIDPMQWTQQTF